MLQTPFFLTVRGTWFTRQCRCTLSDMQLSWSWCSGDDIQDMCTTPTLTLDRIATTTAVAPSFGRSQYRQAKISSKKTCATDDLSSISIVRLVYYSTNTHRLESGINHAASAKADLKNAVEIARGTTTSKQLGRTDVLEHRTSHRHLEVLKGDAV